MRPLSDRRVLPSALSCLPSVLVLLVPFFAVTVSGQSFGGSKQGFGMSKKTIVLHRKLPSMVHLTGTSFAVQAISHDGTQAEIAQMLTDILESTLLKNDNSLRPDKTAPAITIACTITHYETPPQQPFVRQEPDWQNGKSVQVTKSYYKVSGAIDVAYRVAEHDGRILDSDNLSAKYSQDFEQGTNQASQTTPTLGSLWSWKNFAKPKAGAQPVVPPSQAELRQKLLQQMASVIAAHVVNTDEPVEVLLARGKLDDANKLADSGLWTRNLETLETMTPFPNRQDDAYRLYNIGVADEALAYQAEDHAAAKKYLAQAAINYGKAIDAKPSERYFLEPQTRIESAVAHYKKLDDRERAAKPASPSIAAPEVAKVSEKPADTKPPVVAVSLKEKESAALTNEKVVEMSKSGVDEDSILAAIRHAPVVRFDVSPDGLIDLAKNGVKGKVPAAMIARAHPTKPKPVAK